MTSRHIRPLLSAYVDGEVTPAERAQVESHLTSCAECARVLAEYRALGSNIRELSRPLPPPALHPAVWAAIERREAQNTWGPGVAGLLRYGAIAAVLVLAVVVVLIVTRQTTPQLAASMLYPLPDQVGVSRNVSVEIQFTKPVDRSQDPQSVYALAPADDTQPSWDGDDQLTISPTKGWQPNTAYTVTLLTKLRFADNSQLLAPITWHFTTGNTLVTPTPTASATDTPTATPVPTDTPVPTAPPAPTNTVPLPSATPVPATPVPPQPTAVAQNPTIVPPQAPPTVTKLPVPPSTATRAPNSPTPAATATVPRPATSTAEPASPTPRPSETPLPPSATPVPGTDTPVPATDTPEPATDTPTPPASTPEPGSGTPGPVPTQPSPLPSETAGPNGTLTPTITPTEVIACAIQTQGSFGQVYRSHYAVRNVLGCPSAPEAAVAAAVNEQFQHGLMFWNGDALQIYVFNDDAMSWDVYADTWQTGQPDPTVTPPAGLYTPVRGFGKLWSEQPSIKEQLGWALAPETGVSAVLQIFDHGMMLRFNDDTVRILYDTHAWERIPGP